MIGVISKVEQKAAVEEFFELFKTPWEYYVLGRSYDVLVTTLGEVPQVKAGLVVVYGAERPEADESIGIGTQGKHSGGYLIHQGFAVPIYGDLATFELEGEFEACVRTKSGIAGLRGVLSTGTSVVRVGYDLFEEVRLLLSTGQPVEHAQTPSLDIHIAMLRDWILGEGIPLLEIPPSPLGHSFVVCLTHDIDFVGIRNHRFDHTMWGFLYRSTVGAVRSFLRRRISVKRLLETWRAVLYLPFIHLGWAKDFWDPFEWYSQVEEKLPTTYFFIPFKGRKGENVPGKNASRRAAAYELADVKAWATILEKAGCELGVHGIDAWHNVEKGKAELKRISEITSAPSNGIRMHWLLRNSKTAAILEEAGYVYDSSAGYNETIGYRNGSTQVFRPLGVTRLLELPLHVQDGALFYADRLDLSDREAEEPCEGLIGIARRFGGVLTVLWHDRSHGPERFWGDFYKRLVGVLKSTDAWFATAAQAVAWFQQRREVLFERLGTGGLRICACGKQEVTLPQLSIRVYGPSVRKDAKSPLDAPFVPMEIAWNERTVIEFNSDLQRISETPSGLSAFGTH